jgi:hypothetical protein
VIIVDPFVLVVVVVDAVVIVGVVVGPVMLFPGAGVVVATGIVTLFPAGVV